MANSASSVTLLLYILLTMQNNQDLKAEEACAYLLSQAILNDPAIATNEEQKESIRNTFYQALSKITLVSNNGKTTPVAHWKQEKPTIVTNVDGSTTTNPNVSIMFSEPSESRLLGAQGSESKSIICCTGSVCELSLQYTS